ncbi:MAG: amidohydrolase family protein [Patescibacteria group bacterium]
MAYDIIIKSGLVFDGKGNPPISADIGIKGDEIATVGNVGGAEAATRIDASECYVAPGFIDITNHSDTHLTLFKFPLAESMVMQGVTTMIGGNCGTSLAPLGGNAILALRKWADLSEFNANWNTVAEYLAEIGNMGLGVNYGMFAGYGMIRRIILKDETRAMADNELAQARFLAEQSMRDGAFGLSLGLAYGHERLATTEEIITVAIAVAETGGILKIHLRSENLRIFPAINEVVRIARETGVRVQISHLKVIGRKAWPSFGEVLDFLHTARESGVDINFDTTAYSTTGSPLYLLLPDWSREGGFAKLFPRLRDPGARRSIRDALAGRTLHYESIVVLSAKTKEIVGKTIADIAESMGVSPDEALLDILLANDGRVTIVGQTVSPDNTRAAIRDGASFIASDGFGYGIPSEAEKEGAGNLIHPRSFGNFARLWHTFVETEHALAPEEAIRKCTSGPAEKIGLADRGIIAPGFKADVIVFNPGAFRDTATYQKPFRYAEGLSWTLINGKIAVENGRLTGLKAGAVLRKKR